MTVLSSQHEIEILITEAEIAARTKPGDVVMCLGAGDITAWAAALPAALDAVDKARASGAAS